jgi:hypothetical protein
MVGPRDRNLNGAVANRRRGAGDRQPHYWVAPAELPAQDYSFTSISYVWGKAPAHGGMFPRYPFR